MSEVNWRLAQRAANRVARVRSIDDISDLPAGVTVADAAQRVSAYTGIKTPTNLPTLETVSRREWIAAFLNMERLKEASRESSEDSSSRWWEPDQIASRLRSSSRDWRGIELGTDVGRHATSTFGEYFRGPETVKLVPRLLLVAPNLAHSANSHGIDVEDLVSWVTIHEVTHVLQFTGVPWLDTYHDDVFSKLAERPRVSDHELRVRRDRADALQSVLEGHAEHVTDIVGREMLSVPSLREAMMPSWLRGAKLARNIQKRVPGLRRLEVEVHNTPHKAGMDFCDFLAKAGAFDKLWRAPEALPSSSEINNAEQWLARTQQ